MQQDYKGCKVYILFFSWVKAVLRAVSISWAPITAISRGMSGEINTSDSCAPNSWLRLPHESIYNSLHKITTRHKAEEVWRQLMRNWCLEHWNNFV